MTVAEYATWCAEIEESSTVKGLASDVSGITWGEYNKMLLATEQAYASTNPPDILIAYHDYHASLITVMRGVADEKDASLLVKFEDLLDPRFAAIALFAPSTSEFPSDVRQQLLDSGCISEESSTDASGLMAVDSPKEIKRIGVGEEFDGGVEGVAIAIDGFAWEEEIRADEYVSYKPGDESKYLVVTFTIYNRGNQDFQPQLVRESFYVEDSSGVQNHGALFYGIDDVADKRWGVIMADIARAGRTVSTLEIYQIKNRASGHVLRSDGLGVYVDVPESPQ